MKTVAAALHQRTGEDHKARAVATIEWLAMKPAQGPDADSQDIRFDFMTSIWSGATAGCIDAAGDTTFPESRS
jgi:hypothetical protein